MVADSTGPEGLVSLVRICFYSLGDLFPERRAARDFIAQELADYPPTSRATTLCHPTPMRMRSRPSSAWSHSPRWTNTRSNRRTLIVSSVSSESAWARPPRASPNPGPALPIQLRTAHRLPQPQPRRRARYSALPLQPSRRVWRLPAAGAAGPGGRTPRRLPPRW